MGGEAFRKASADGEPTLDVQRQSPDDHARLESLYIERIQRFLSADIEVVALIPEPEKQDYGDIDIIIASEPAIDLHELAIAVGATGFISENPVICNLAVRQDGSRSSRPVVVYRKTQEPNEDVSAEEYVQMDVEVIAPADMEWIRFYWSYGGVGGIIGMMIRALGFTMSSSRGLILLLKEHSLVEELNLGLAEKEASIMLTKSPTEVMCFLGLSVEAYQKGFRTVGELCTWLGACRMLSREALKVVEHSDRRLRSESKRSMFLMFKHEWVPANVPLVLPTDSPDEVRLAYVAKLRAQAEHAAVLFFHQQEEYATIRPPFLSKIQVAAAVHFLRPIVIRESGYGPGSKRLPDIMRGIKQWVGAHSGGLPYTLPAAAASGGSSQLGGLLTEDDRGLQAPEAVTRYIVENWEELGRKGKK